MAISVETITLFKAVLLKLRGTSTEPSSPIRIIIKIEEVREKGAKRL